MAINVNEVTLIGRVGKDPESRGSGFAVFSVATNRVPYKDKKTGDKVEKTDWHNVVVFTESTAKFCMSYVKKGDTICVKGRLETRTYEKDGEKRYSTEVVVADYSHSVQAISKDGGGSRSRSNDRDDGYKSQDDFGQSSGGYGGGFSRDLDDEIPFAPEFRV